MVVERLTALFDTVPANVRASIASTNCSGWSAIDWRLEHATHSAAEVAEAVTDQKPAIAVHMKNRARAP